VAQAAREELELSRLFFIPLRNHLSNRSQTHRPNEQLCASCAWHLPENLCESTNRKSPARISYTIDTARDYHRRFQGAEIFYLIWRGQCRPTPQVRESAELAPPAAFVVIPGPARLEVPIPAPFRGRMLKGSR